jgi:DNA primase catalytic core
MVASHVSNLPKKQETPDALSHCLEDAINRLSAEQIYTHPAHNFKQSGDRLRGGCPLHQSSSGSSFVVTISSKLFYCAGCQFGGSPADYQVSLKAGRWVKARGRDFVEAVKELATGANVPFPNRESSPEEIARAQKWERRRAVLAATQEYCQETLWSDTEAALEARHYLVAERGLTEEEIKLLPIGYYPSAGEVKRHLMSKGFTKEDWESTGCVWKDMERYITFLWNDASGRPLTIYGRYFRKHPPEHKPKTIASPGEKTKQSPLYFDRAIKAGYKEIVLVEGVLDAVLLQAKGDTRVCAYVAASCSGDQIETLKRRGITKVTLCGDPDHGGENGTNSNLLRLTGAGISVYISPKLPDGLDPDEFLIREGMEGWKAHIDAAEHGFRWKAKRLIESGNVTSDKGKAEVLHSAIAFCKAVKNHPELDTFFWPVIRSNLGMEPEEFRAQLERLWESSPVEVVELGGGSGGSGGDGGDRTPTSSRVVKFPGFEPASLEEVTQEIDKLIDQSASGSKLTAELNRLAAASQLYVGELRKLYQERLGEVEVEGDRDTTRDEIGNLLKLTDQSLDLADYLPPSLTEPLSKWCEWLALRPAVVLTALLTGASTLHKVGTELVIHRNKHFKVPPTIYSALVAESGQLKSPVFSNIVRLPLNKLRQEALDAYKAAMEDHEAAMEAWEKSEKKEKKPEPPKEPTLFYFTGYSGESIPVQTSKAPEKAMLALIDELSGLFNSANSYRGGRGADKQDLLSYFDGSGQTVLRVSGVKVDVERIYLSIFGTIQPEILKNHMMDCTDPDGQWARFLFVNQPQAFAPLGDDDGQAVSISDRIADFYRRLHRLPEIEYRLSRSAFKRYEPFHDQLERLRVTHPKAGMRAVYSKMKGYVGRLALNLHALWELDAGKDCPDEEIPLFIMEMAIALTKFYIGQIKLVHSDSDSESLPRHITKLIELSKRLEANGQSGWIKAQMYRDQFDSKKRPSAQQARDWMNEAATLGYGHTRGTGNRLEYHWFSDNKGDDNQPTPPNHLGKLREDLGKSLPVVETIGNKGLEDNLGNLGKDIPIFSPTEADSSKTGEEWSEPSLEGGYLPEPSLSIPQQSYEPAPMGDIDLGNNLGIPFPNLPEVPLNADANQPLTDSSNVVEVASTTPIPSPLSQKPSIEVADSTAVEDAIAPTAAIQNAPEALEPTAAAEIPQDSTAKPATEAITVSDDGWKEGDRVVVDASELPPSLRGFDGRRGIVDQVKQLSEQCFVDFGDDEFMHIPFRGLRKA